MTKELFELENYLMTSEAGCLLANPQIYLTPYFKPWQKIAKLLPTLYKNKTLRDEVHTLELLDHEKMEGYQQLFLAHMQLAFISSGYVWQNGDSGVAKSLPRCIAIPLYHISRRLGVKPIISHIDVCLSNWDLIDQNGLVEFSNLQCVCHIPGESQGDHFCLVTAGVEIEFARCLNPLISSLNLLLKREVSKALDEEEEGLMLTYLESMSHSIKSMKKAITMMNDGLEAETFFNEIRPFLAGWGGPNSPLPDGLIFEGISEEPIQLSGGSAAQSTSMQLLDAFFGVTHTEGEEKFLKEMRGFMPPAHAKLIADVENSPAQLTSYVRSLASPAVKTAYNKCIAAITEFRSYHMNIVSKYILKPSRVANKKKYESLDAVGTGGSDLIPFLKKIRSNTQKQIVDTVSNLHTFSRTSFYVLALIACIVSVIVTLVYT